MKVYIQSNSDYFPSNYNFYNAYQGFHEMGFETVMFHTPDDLSLSSREDVVVGYVADVRSRLKDFGIENPDIDYPDEISKYLGRKIWFSKINTINSHPEL